jgi:tRNA threonylcarbamoyladenosine biosynthesis protein TsaB
MKQLILNIETTTKNCSVSLAENGVLVALKEINEGSYSHAEHLHPFIDVILNEVGKEYSDITAVAVSKGPGSYTGLRIGVSAAKGFCYALEIPMISIDTLASLAHVVQTDNAIIIPMLDARRMEVYQAVFTADYKHLEQTKAQVVEENTYDTYLNKSKVYFVGDAVEKIQTIISHPNAVFVANEFPSAKEMAPLSYEKFIIHDFEDVAYFEPYYLKDFIAVKSTKKYF